MRQVIAALFWSSSSSLLSALLHLSSFLFPLSCIIRKSSESRGHLLVYHPLLAWLFLLNFDLQRWSTIL